MKEPLLIDTRMHGYAGITGAFVVAGERTALIETGPRSAVDNVLEGLTANGIDALDYIIVTHIHLDHAGAAGTLAKHFPDATVAVHEVGALHLVDPSKLWASAGRIYGDDMDRLWGGIDPIDDNRIRALVDGDQIDLGGRTLTALDTPGHAYHHHAFLDDSSGALFTGDALGVRLSDAGIMRPATPPPEFHLAKAIESIEKIRAAGPASLWLTHFGPQSGGETPLSVDEACDGAIEALRKWAEWVQAARVDSDDLDAITARVTESAQDAYATTVSADAIARMEQTTSYWMNTWGYKRYFDKLEAAEKS